MTNYQKNIAQQLETYLPNLTGSLLASLFAVKGIPGASEQAGGLPFSGEDGLALDKAFGRLGWGFGSLDTRTWCGVALSMPSHAPLSPQTLRFVCETIDPLLIIALDETARLALLNAFSFARENLAAVFTRGGRAQVLGRHLVSVDGFEASLADEDSKQKAWAQLKRCVPPSLP